MKMIYFSVSDAMAVAKSSVSVSDQFSEAGPGSPGLNSNAGCLVIKK
jgi:hypothetical protein